MTIFSLVQPCTRGAAGSALGLSEGTLSGSTWIQKVHGVMVGPYTLGTKELLARVAVRGA